ncbi:MAG: thioesterase [Candidatus Kapabacteria bacterium]|nr:thioesterase [Candidatus Kapabacteria bacterium]
MNPAVEHSRGTVSITVTPDMTAQLDGREIHPVYSTFWLGYHAEVAARRAIEPYFDEGENAVGGALSITHHAMCAVGRKVDITATVVRVGTKSIVCDVRAVDERGTLLATGSQTQIVLPQREIDALIATAYKPAAD